MCEFSSGHVDKCGSGWRGGGKAGGGWGGGKRGREGGKQSLKGTVHMPMLVDLYICVLFHE